MYKYHLGVAPGQFANHVDWSLALWCLMKLPACRKVFYYSLPIMANTALTGSFAQVGFYHRSLAVDFERLSVVPAQSIAQDLQLIKEQVIQNGNAVQNSNEQIDD